jgi:cellulose synthase/poly-beta-1,6-N-acetylglucosamine synthase-like glycosyltransferase
MEFLFFLMVFGLIYSYAIYPLILKLMPVRHRLQASAVTELPPLTLIITAHNEEKRIREKLENTLAIDYPRDLLDIIVASDCSTDATDAIVQEYASRGVTLVRADQHLGKEYAQLCAIRASKHDIIVFSDVATQIPENALRILAGYFAHPHIGAVSSEDRFISDEGKIAGEGAYVKYEMWLRALESERAGLVGLSGSFFAARKSVCDEWDTLSPSDFNTALSCARAGLVSVSSPDVLGYYRDLKNPKKEYDRKVRTVLRGITALFRHTEVLDFARFGQFAVQVWSHKLMRWAVPFFMLGTALTSLALYGEGWIYTLAVWVQLAFYGVAAWGWKSPAAQQHTAVRIIFFFVQVNIAIAHAWLKYLRGTRMTVWTPSQR